MNRRVMFDAAWLFWSTLAAESRPIPYVERTVLRVLARIVQR